MRAKPNPRCSAVFRPRSQAKGQKRAGARNAAIAIRALKPGPRPPRPGAMRAHVFPRATAILLIVGAVVTVLPLPFTSLVLDVAVAWLGFALFAERGAPAERPARVS